MPVVIFDLFDTLVSLAPDAYPAAKTRMAAALGADPQAFLQAWRALSPRSNKGEFASIEERVRCAAKSLNLAVGVSEVDAAADLERAMQSTAYQLLPGAVQTLEALRDAGYRLGLLSNCYVGAQGVTERLGLRDFFADVTLSFQVGLCKPDPKLYYYVCERLGCQPTQTWFAGDGNDRELDGAKAAGMRTVLVKGVTSAAWATTPSSSADYVAPSIAAVADLILGADSA